MRNPPPRTELATCATLLLVAAAAAAAPPLPPPINYDGQLDHGFGGDGVVAWTGGADNSVELADVAVKSDGRIFGVGTLTAGSALPALHFQSFDEDGTGGHQFCYLDSSDLFQLSTRSQGRAAIIDSSGNLLVGGAVNILGTPNVTRALLARFALDQDGCVLDTSYNSAGWEILDDSPYCDTENCLIVDLAEIRPATGAVASPRVVALLESRTTGSASRLVLVGLTASGALVSSFGSGGYRELTGYLLGALLTDQGNRITVDRQGRIYLLATRHDPVQASDDDVVLARFTADGDLDPEFGDGGVRYALESDTEDDYARDLVALPDGRVLLAAQRGSTGQSFFGALDANGFQIGLTASAGAAYAIGVAGQSDGRRLHLYQLPSVDGGKVSRWLDGPLDGSFGSGGIASYDVDLGGSDADAATVLQLSAGRPVIAGTADRDGTRTAGFIVRLTNRLILADGFESGRTLQWTKTRP